MANSTWLKIAQAYAGFLFNEGLTGVDELPVLGPPDLADMRVQYVKRFQIRKPWMGEKVLSFVPQTETQGISGNSEDLIGYGIGVVLAWPSNSDLESELDEWLEWREVVRIQSLPTTEQIFSLSDPQIESITWEPGVIYDPSNYEKQYDAQGFTLRAWVYEPRKSRDLA